jgi:PIN domain nuclease of toxin-antitoxin system
MIPEYPSGPILLDTEAVIWAVLEPERLSSFVRQVCELPEYELCVSVASFWEIVIKVQSGKWLVTDPVLWFLKWTQGMRYLPIGYKDVADLAKLPAIHKDPFDRIILAQALQNKMPLVTSDRKMLQDPDIRFVW